MKRAGEKDQEKPAPVEDQIVKPRSGDAVSCLESSSQILLSDYEAITDDLVMDSARLIES